MKGSRAKFTGMLFILAICAPCLAYAQDVTPLFEHSSFVLSVRDDSATQEVEAFVKLTEDELNSEQSTIFTLINPARLVFDISGINKPVRFEREMTDGRIQRIRGANFEGKQRIVIEMISGLSIKRLSSLKRSRKLRATLLMSGNHITPVNTQLTTAAVLTKKILKPTPLNLRGYAVDKLSSVDTIPSLTTYITDETLLVTPILSSFGIDNSPQVAKTATTVSNPIFQVAKISRLSLSKLGSQSLLFLALPLLLFLISISLFVSFRKQSLMDAGYDEFDEEEEVKLPTEIIELPTLAEAYRVLGCFSDDNDRKLKKHYRRLLKAFHEDKLVSKDLPSELMTVSRREFDKVRAAFERLKIDRPTLD